MTSDDPETVIDGSITADADWDDVAAIQQAIRERGFAVDIDFSDGSLTVRRGPDVEPGGEVQLSDEYQGMSSTEIIAAVRDEHSLDEDDSDDPAGQESADDSERSDTEDGSQQDDTDADAEQAAEDSSQPDEQDAEEREDDQQADEEEDDQQEEQELTKRERRIQRLKDGIEDGTAYTSDEVAAIAYDKAAADVKPNERAYVSGMRSNGDIDLESMDDPNRNGTAKLYYRGEQPDIDEASEEREAGHEPDSSELSSSGDDADDGDRAGN